MSRIRWLCWAMTLSVIFLLVPAKGWCVRVDPYIYRSLIGRVAFEFERETRTSGNSSRTPSSFSQRYSLDSKGNIVSRRLIIYDAGVSFIKKNYFTATSDSGSANLNYYLTTSFLPQSRIPLKLYGRRGELTSSTKSRSRSTTVNTYGLDWRGIFVKLPETRVVIERESRRGAGGESHSMEYRLELDKELGPTRNSFNARYN